MSGVCEQGVLLDGRLRAVAGFLPAGARFADIGCDHGYLGAWLLEHDPNARCMFTDISAPSLEKARRLTAELGLEDRASFHVGDGALALHKTPDCAVIAGMGAHTIIEILRAGRERLAGARLVMQPNLAQEDLRAYLSDTGYKIIGESIARAGRRLYVILAAEPGEERLSAVQRLCGPRLLELGDPLFPAYARFRMRVAQKALQGASETDPARAAQWREELALWEEGLACCQP